MSNNDMTNNSNLIINIEDDENNDSSETLHPNAIPIGNPIIIAEQNLQNETSDEISDNINKKYINDGQENSSNSQSVVTNEIFSKSLDNSKLLSHKHLDDIQSVSESEQNSVIEKNGSKPNSTGQNEAVASWDVAGTSQPINRKCVRSKSWCGPRLNDDKTIDIRLLRERLLRTQPHPKPAEIKNFTRKQKLTLMSLALVDFMSFCSMSIMAPFFPREAKEKGMTEAIAGFVFSFYALVMFISSPIFGKITPIVGARFLFISGIFVTGSCNLLFGVLEYIPEYELFTLFCFLIRGFEALGASAYSTASYVFVVNMFPNNISSVLGILETFVGLGMSVGPAVGGLLYSIGGFGLPFYVLGVSMILIIPLNLYLMPIQDDLSIEHKSGSILELIKVPAIIITGLVIVVVSNTWAFLDPTLEPHLRQFDLSPEQVGLVFLLFSALYGIFSPIWGWLADKINRHWCMMVWGLSFCTVGLLLLGPSPFLPFLESSLMLNIIGLSIIGISVALTLLPTFQGVLTCSIEEGGCRDNIGTYSVVAGIWSCMYSLGEVIGPSLGGVLLKNYGFPICSTVMASLTFALAIITFIFFACKENPKLASHSESISDTNTNENWTFSNDPHTSESALNPNSDAYESDTNEDQPLLPGYSKNTSKGRRQATRQSYGGFDDSKNAHCKNDPRSENVNVNQNILKYDNFDKNLEEQLLCINRLESLLNNDGLENIEMYEGSNNSEQSYVNDTEYYQSTEFGNADKVMTEKNNLRNRESYNAQNKLEDFWNYSLDKIKYYNQSRKYDYLDSNLDRNQVSDVRGMINLTGNGACEV